MTASRLRIFPTITLFRFFWLTAAFFALIADPASTADLPSPAGAPVRLAVLAEDVSPETLALADLLTLELAKLPGIETVERAEIERVLDEQKLTAEGLVGPESRIRLGRILRSAGLIFVQRDVDGDRFLFRLTETQRGFIAGFCTTPVGNRAQPGTIATELCGMLPKLSLDLSRQTTVSLFRFSTALLPSSVPPHSSEEHFEARMVMRLMVRFSKEPDIVVTERRRMGDLAREKQLDGQADNLTRGAFLIDGEVATATHLKTPEGDEAVTLTVRIRERASGLLAPVVLTGARKDLDRLITTAAEAAGDALLEHRHAKRGSESSQIESESLLRLARQKGLVWAGEAAYALNPTNPVIRDAYLKTLLDEGCAQLQAGAAPRDAYMKIALALSRAEQVAREQHVFLWDFSFYARVRSELRNNLEQAVTRSDPEIAQLLRPFRAIMLQGGKDAAQLRKDPTCAGADYAFLVEWSTALCETAAARKTFIESLLDRAATDSTWPEPMRDYLVSYLLTQHHWPSTVFAEHGIQADPVRRFYGQYGLMWNTFGPKQQRAHAREALNTLEALLQRPGAFGSYFFLPRIYGSSNCWLSNALREIRARYPDYAVEVSRKMFTRMRELYAIRDYRSLCILEPDIHLRSLPWSEIAPWLDEVKVARTGAPSPEYAIGEMFKTLAKLRQERMSEPTPSSGSKRFRRQILLQDGAFNGFWHTTDSGGGTLEFSKKFAPQRLLLQNDTLWTGLAGDYHKDKESGFWVFSCGLAQIDLPSGRIRSVRSGWLKTTDKEITSLPQVKKDGVFYYCPLQPIRPWRNWIVVAHGNGGMALFPFDSPSRSADLSGVSLLTSSSGLPVTKVDGWATLGDTLYVRSQDRLVVGWDANTRKATLLFDNMRQITGVSMPEHDKFSVDDLWTDETAQRLILTGTFWLRRGVQSWYSPPQKSSDCLIYHPATTRWTYSQEAPTRPSVEPDRNVKAREALQAEGIEDVLDVAVWHDKIFALIGYNESWRLELLTEK